MAKINFEIPVLNPNFVYAYKASKENSLVNIEDFCCLTLINANMLIRHYDQES